jgi:hypothetical protein
VTVPADVTRYLQQLVEQLDAVLGNRLLGVYGLGGLALDDYRDGRSDLDVYAVVDDALEVEQKLEIARRCAHRAVHCPAPKLELVVISAAAAGTPGGAPRWELNLNTGAGLQDHVGVDPDTEPSHWFVIDLAIAHRVGVALWGPPAPDLIGRPPSADVQAAQSAVTRWFSDHGMHAEAAAAACRAWYWSQTGRFTGKREALRWAATRFDSQCNAPKLPSRSGGGAELELRCDAHPPRA